MIPLALDRLGTDDPFLDRVQLGPPIASVLGRTAETTISIPSSHLPSSLLNAGFLFAYPPAALPQVYRPFHALAIHASVIQTTYPREPSLLGMMLSYPVHDLSLRP